MESTLDSRDMLDSRANRAKLDKQGRYVYEAVNPTIWTQCLAVITLTALFFTTLCYFVLVPAALYFMFMYGSFWMLAVFVIVLSSPYWASGTWHAVGDSFVLHTWRLYFQFKVYMECDLKQ